MAANSNLQMSRATRADEFYTQLSIIEDELWHYREFFEEKIFFCNADDIINYFKDVITWVEAIFPYECKSLMNGLPWGIYYNKYKNTNLDPILLESKIKELLQDDDVTNQKGIYEYVLSGDERSLQIRTFDCREARLAYERQNHKCAICGKECEFEEMHADHITPWSKGGKTVPENCQMLCRDCNLRKGAQ